MDAPPELRTLRNWLDRPAMPSVDLDAMFEQLYYALSIDQGLAFDELHGVVDGMVFNDFLFGHNDLDDQQCMDLAQLLLNAGMAIAAQLGELRMYREDGYFPYRFKGIRGHGTLLFEAASED